MTSHACHFHRRVLLQVFGVSVLMGVTADIVKHLLLAPCWNPRGTADAAACSVVFNARNNYCVRLTTSSEQQSNRAERYVFPLKVMFAAKWVAANCSNFTYSLFLVCSISFMCLCVCLFDLYASHFNWQLNWSSNNRDLSTRGRQRHGGRQDIPS